LTGIDTVVAVVLAAGLSQRFGTDKLVYPFNGKPLASHIADTLAAMPLGQRLAICPPGHPERRALFAARGFSIAENRDAARGLASSLALAAQCAIDLKADAMLVCLADMPNVTAAHLLALCAASAGNDIVATQSAGTRSPPAIFARSMLPLLLVLTGDEGARRLLRTAATVEASPDLVRDIDAQADLG
jgi:molybdenum cofactor cytidylyltransferase